MAALTTANVRLIKTWTEAGVNGKKRRARQVEVHGGSWGGETNTMPAAAFALSKIEEVSPAIYGLKGFHIAPSADGSVAYIFDTVGAASAPADVTLPATPSGLYFIVRGW